jgi:hypothetical protein
MVERTHDLVVGDGDAHGAEQERGRLATLAVDGDDELAALVDLELEPSTTRGDELHVMDQVAVVDLLGEVHTRGADELGDDDTLGAVDDEGAALGHEREVAHEDELLLDLACLLVDEADVNEERSLVGDVLGTALLHGMRGIAELVLAERDLHGPGGVLDRARLGEGLGKALVHEAVEGLLLDTDQVGKLHDLVDLAEAHPPTLGRGGGIGRLCGTHQAFPPSKWRKAAVVAN